MAFIFHLSSLRPADLHTDTIRARRYQQYDFMTSTSSRRRRTISFLLFGLLCIFGICAQFPLLQQLFSTLALQSSKANDSVDLTFITSSGASIGTAVNSIVHRPLSIGNNNHHHELETTISCTGYCCHSLKVNNRSCYYQNLYLEVTADGSGTFWAFFVDDGSRDLQLLEDPSSLVVSTHTRLYCQGPFPPETKPDPPRFIPHPNLCSTENLTHSDGTIAKTYDTTKYDVAGHDVLLFAGPKVKRFSTEQELESHVQALSTGGKLTRRKHDVYGMIENHWNFAHHTLEAIYAAWMSTAKFGLENETICFVTTPGSYPHNGPDGKPLSPDLDPSSTFGGCPRIVWEELTAAPIGRWIQFDKFVLGFSGGGMEHRNEYYEASMYDPDAADVTYLPRRFRSRMYDSYSIQRPQERSSSGEHRAKKGEDGLVELKALLVPNKRDWGDLNAMVDAINTELASYRGAMKITAQVLDWSKHNTLRSQLEVLRDVDIYVSSVGTGLTMQYFLPDGSVVVNVGWSDGFWEEHLVAANRHLGAVYPNSVKETRSSREVVVLVQEAADKIISDFAIPVPRGESLSKYGKAFSTFLRSDEGKELNVLHMINFQYQMDHSAGSRSKGCYRVVGHLASAFYWACGNKYSGTAINPRCHPGTAFMEAVRKDNDLNCPDFQQKVVGGLPKTGGLKAIINGRKAKINRSHVTYRAGSLLQTPSLNVE